jgi:hypothetical protein
MKAYLIALTALAVEPQAYATCINEPVFVEVEECREIPSYPNLPRLDVNGLNVTGILSQFQPPIMRRHCFIRYEQRIICATTDSPTPHQSNQ